MSYEIDRKERRRASRRPSHAAIELLDVSGNHAGAARMHDLSDTGARFDIALEFKEGTEFQARMQSPKEGVRKITARVIWAKPKSRSILYGVEFQSAHPTSS